MKKIIFKFTFLLCITIASTSIISSSSGPTNTDATGSPFDTNQDACTQCHNSYSLNSGSGNISLTAPASYYPGETYTITVTVAQSVPTPARYGFQLLPLRDNNTSGGSITSGSGQGTWTSSGRSYVQHNSTINTSGVWSFTWNAPSYSDTIKLFGAGLAANGANGNQLDYCYTTTSTILPIAPIQFTMDSTNASCYETCDGQASVSVSGGGVGPYTYLWSTGATTSTITGLCANTYTVTITDSQGHEEEGQIEVNEPSQIQTMFEILPSSCAFGNGQISVKANGGSGGYTYLWNDTANTTDSVIMQAGVGWFTVTITDAAGCSFVDSSEIIASGSGLNAFLTQESDNCNLSNGEANITMLAGNPPYSFQWSQGSTTQSINGLSAGIYTVTVTDDIGCEDFFNTEVEAEFLIIDTLTSSTKAVRCFNGNDGEIDIDISSGESPFTYTWSHDTLANLGKYSNLKAGIYTVTVSDLAGCQDSISLQVLQPDSVYATNTIDSANEGFCDGALSIVMHGGTPPYSYQWPHDNSITSNSSSDLCPGSYLVTTTDVVGCLFLVNTAVPIKLGIGLSSTEPFSVFPNPCSDLLSIVGNTHNVDAYTIYDANGALVLSQKSSSPFIDVHHLSNGNYVLKIEGETVQKSIRFIIQK